MKLRFFLGLLIVTLLTLLSCSEDKTEYIVKTDNDISLIDTSKSTSSASSSSITSSSSSSSTVIDSFALQQVTNLTAELKDNKVVLTWAPLTDASYYTIYYDLGDSVDLNFALSKLTTTNTASLDTSNFLQNNTKYSFLVIATNNNDINSKPSNIVTITYQITENDTFAATPIESNTSYTVQFTTSNKNFWYSIDAEKDVEVIIYITYFDATDVTCNIFKNPTDKEPLLSETDLREIHYTPAETGTLYINFSSPNVGTLSFKVIK